MSDAKAKTFNVAPVFINEWFLEREMEIS
jgi:hypothetical protein